MTEQGTLGKNAQLESVGGEEAGQAAETGRRFMEDLYTLPESFRKNDFYQPNPDFKNGLASEKLQDIEKWADDARHCGLAVDQNELTKKLIEFGKNTDEMWKRMGDSENPDERFSKDLDTFATYDRWQNLLSSLDEKHLEQVKESLGEKHSFMLQGE